MDWSRVPVLVIRQPLPPGKFAPPPGTLVEFRRVHAQELDFSRAHFFALHTSGCLFTRCDFRHMQIEYGGTLSERAQSVYRECRFDHADLSQVDPWTARFEKCNFDRANLGDWNCFEAEFIDCHFAGRIKEVKCWGKTRG